jgi:hypothetical protein
MAASGSIVLAFGVDERLHGQPQLGGQLVFPERAEEGDRGFVGAQLRDAARTLLQMLLELLPQRGGQLTFQVVRQEANDTSAPSHAFSHSASNAECRMPNVETVQQLFGIQHSPFDINQR